MNIIKWCGAYNSTSLGSGSWGHIQKKKKKAHFHSHYCSVWVNKKVAQKWTKNNLMSGLISPCKAKYVSPWVMKMHGDAVTCTVKVKRPFKDISAILREVSLVQSLLSIGKSKLLCLCLENTLAFPQCSIFFSELNSLVGFGSSLVGCHRES